MIRNFGDKSQLHGFGPFFLRAAVFGGGDPGEALLDGSLAYWDVLYEPGTNLTTADVDFDPDVTTWSTFGVATVAGSIDDPDGGTGAYRISASGSGTATARYSSTGDTTPGGPGYGSLSGKCRVLSTRPGQNDCWIATTNSPAGSSRIVGISETEERTNEAEQAAYLPQGGLGRLLGWRFEDEGDDDGWRTFRIDSCIPGNSAINYDQLGSVVCTTDGAGDIVELYDLSYTQTRITSLAPRAGVGTLTQATNVNKPTIAPNAWLGFDAWMCGDLSSQSLDASIAVGTDPFLLIGCCVPTRVQTFGAGDTTDGTTDDVVVLSDAGGSAEVALTCVEASDDSTTGLWGWRRTNDAASSASGSFAGSNLPSVPVCVAVYFDGSNVSLWVDGQQVGSSAAVTGTTDIDTISIRGRESWTLHSSWAVRAGTHTEGQIAAIATTLRSRARLPALWKPIHHSGQSNSTHNGFSINHRSMRNVPFRVGNSFCKREEGGSAFVPPWTPAPATRSWDISGLTGISYGGVMHGFLAEAALNGDYGYLVVATGQGGTSIDRWMSSDASPTMYTHTRAVWTAAIANVGTHLVGPREWSTWVQGEADVDPGKPDYSPGAYEDALENYIDQEVADFGGSEKIIVHRLNENHYVDGSNTTDGQDTFCAVDATNRKLTRADADGLHYDGLHYNKSSVWVGRNMYRQGIQGAGELIPFDPSQLSPVFWYHSDYPWLSLDETPDPDEFISMVNQGSGSTTIITSAATNRPPVEMLDDGVNPPRRMPLFDGGSDDGFTISNALSEFHRLYDSGSDATLWFRCRVDSFAAFQSLLSLRGSGATPGLNVFTVITSGALRFSFADGSSTNDHDTAPIGTGWHDILLKKSGTTITVYIDGAASSINGATISTPSATVGGVGIVGNYPGWVAPLDGVIPEMAVFPSAISDADREKLRRYGIGWWR